MSWGTWLHPAQHSIILSSSWATNHIQPSTFSQNTKRKTAIKFVSHTHCIYKYQSKWSWIKVDWIALKFHCDLESLFHHLRGGWSPQIPQHYKLQCYELWHWYDVCSKKSMEVWSTDTMFHWHGRFNQVLPRIQRSTLTDTGSRLIQNKQNISTRAL